MNNPTHTSFWFLAHLSSILKKEFWSLGPGQRPPRNSEAGLQGFHSEFISCCGQKKGGRQLRAVVIQVIITNDQELRNFTPASRVLQCLLDVLQLVVILQPLVAQCLEAFLNDMMGANAVA